MKRYILFITLILLSTSTTYACEICGCSHSNFQIGLLPKFNKGFAGIRYSYSNFASRMKDEPSEFSNDAYQSIEVWGGYNIKKFQFMAFMPYVISRKEHDDGVTHTEGAGDLMLLVSYKVLTSATLSENEKSTIKHELLLGGGIKLPTGLNPANPDDPGFNIGDFNSQPGTGSIDYLLTGTYNLLWNRTGIVTNAAWRINTANDQDYKFGNRMYLSSSCFYTFTSGKTKLMPNAGLNFQSNTINTFKDENVEASNGYTLTSPLGLNALHKKIGFNATVFVPLAQNNFDHQTKLETQVLLGVTYSF